MPEPRAPEQGQETLTLGETKPGATIAQENQKADQARPEDKDRYAGAERQDEEQARAEDVEDVEDIEDLEDVETVEGTDDAEDLDDAGDTLVPSDDLSDQGNTDKHAGRMLDPKNLPEGDE